MYFGLLVFVGYVIVDTQVIIEMAHFGDLDYVKHSLTLFTDLAAIFVRILIIMVSRTGVWFSKILIGFLFLFPTFELVLKQDFRYPFTVEEFIREK